MTWRLSECKSIIVSTLNCSDEFAGAMIRGAGVLVYPRKFDRGLSPQQCIDDEMVYWNE
jgi:hypothetical protein